MPVGTALAGTVAAVVALCATAVFGASLSHLTGSPELYGAPFQAVFDTGTGATGQGSLLTELIVAVEAAMRRSNWEGVNAPQLFAGAIGPDAGALGGALLPLHANFAPDRDLFIKEHS